MGEVGGAVHGIDDPAGRRNGKVFRAFLSEESRARREGGEAFLEEALHGDVGFGDEIDAPLASDGVGLRMVGADDRAALPDDGEGLPGQSGKLFCHGMIRVEGCPLRLLDAPLTGLVAAAAGFFGGVEVHGAAFALEITAAGCVENAGLDVAAVPGGSGLRGSGSLFG